MKTCSLNVQLGHFNVAYLKAFFIMSIINISFYFQTFFGCSV